MHFKPKDVLKLCLDFNESKLIHAYKCYAYIYKKNYFPILKTKKKLLVKYMLACNGEMLTNTKNVNL